MLRPNKTFVLFVLLWLKVFAARANFPPLGSLRGHLLPQHSILVLCVILRSAATKNLLLAFLSWSKEFRKSAKQMLHFVQHDTTANSEHLEGFGFLSDLCGFAQVTPPSVAALPRWVLCGEMHFFVFGSVSATLGGLGLLV